MPYGIGAKFAHPDRPVIVFAGDGGAMQMNGLAELITVKRYWQRWDDPRLIVAVLHNNDLNQVTWEMRAMSGAPKFVESQTLPDVDYAAFAAGLGLDGVTVTAPGRTGLGVGDGSVGGPPDPPGRAHRPEHASHPAARDLGSVQVRRSLGPTGRRGRVGGFRQDGGARDQGSGDVAPRERVSP